MPKTDARKWLNTGALLAGAIIALLGLHIANSALHEYKKANTNYEHAAAEAANARLAALDRDAYLEAMKDDKLNVLFTEFPTPQSKEEARTLANKIIVLALGDKHKNINISFSSIEELFKLIYSIDNFHDEYKQILRKASIHSDLIFYTVDSAYTAFKSKIITREEYDTWKGYLRDVGKNPLFILSIYIAYEAGYIGKDFCREIQTTIVNNPTSFIMMQAIYPEMEFKSWIENFDKQDKLIANKLGK